MKILLIEDDDAIRATLRDMLELNGHTALTAENGLRGILLASAKPDLIFCDIGLPDLDGYQVLNSIRKLESLGETPFIFLTAKASRDDQRHGMTLGADDYITKPFTESEILASIDSRIQRQKPLRERIEGFVRRHANQVNAPWSHELLTPLNGVLGGLELLDIELASLNRPDLVQLLSIVKDAADRQHQLSRKLIRYYNLERIQIPNTAQARPCAAAPALAYAVSRAEIEERIRTTVTLSCEPANLALPQDHLVDAVTELVSNAIKFTRANRYITVDGRITPEGNYLITVCDNGPGLSEAQRSQIGAFIQFERHKFQQQGLGLGLVTVQSIARIHGGSLSLDTPPSGIGLRALLQLPLLPAS